MKFRFAMTSTGTILQKTKNVQYFRQEFEYTFLNDFYFSERDSKVMTKYGQNLTSVIARYCYGRVPKSCDHGVLNDSMARPCTTLESYVSSNDYVTLELRNIESTVLQYVFLSQKSFFFFFFVFEKEEKSTRFTVKTFILHLQTGKIQASLRICRLSTRRFTNWQ